MKGLPPPVYEGWCQPVAIPIIHKPGDYSVRPGTRWCAPPGTWKRMPYQTFPLITTYVRGALPYYEHAKLMSTSGLVVQGHEKLTSTGAFVVQGQEKLTRTNGLVAGQEKLASTRGLVAGHEKPVSNGEFVVPGHEKVVSTSGLVHSVHEKLMSTNGLVPPTHEKLVSTTGLVVPLQRAAVNARVASGTQTSTMVREDACMKPRVLTKVIECEDTKYVPKVEVRTVKRTVEIASKTEKRFVPRQVPVDTPFIVPRFEDREVPVVVSNTISPEIEETEAVVEVPVARYVPHLVPINVYVPRAVAIPVVLTDETKHEAPAALPKESLQQLIKELNPHLAEIDKFNAAQNTRFQELLQKSQNAAHIANCPVPEPQSTPILKITAVEPEGQESDRLVKQICFSTGGYEAAEVESLFTALTATSTTDSEADATLAHKELSGEQTDPDTHDDMLSAATGASDSQRCTSVVSGKDAAEGVTTASGGKSTATSEERKDNRSNAGKEPVVEEAE